MYLHLFYNLSWITGNDTVVGEGAVNYTPSSNNNIIAQLGSLKDYGVHADEAIFTYLNRSPSGIFLIQSFVAILQLYWMKVVIDYLAVGAYTSIVAYLDGVPRINGAATYPAMFANLNLTSIASYNDATLVQT